MFGMAEGKQARGRAWLGPMAVWAAVMAWLTGWIFSLGPTLINDEYAAIDYFYRIVRAGRFYPTPDKLHKPLSVAFGFFAWAAESPLAYEVVIAAFAAAFVVLVWRVGRRELGPAFGALAAAAVGLHPDLIYYSATGSTIMPFIALAMLGLYAVLRRDEGERWLWVYAVSFMVAGLVRPDAWLFAAPILVWWRPRDRRGWVRAIAAGAVIGLAPLLWFGTDFLINGDFMHGMKIAVRDKTIGMGAPLSARRVTELFWLRTASIVSWPVIVGGLAGVAVFFNSRGFRKALLHPFVIAPLLVCAYIWMIVYGGVFPVQRYYYFDSVFIILFALALVKRLAREVDADRGNAAGQFGFSAAVVVAVAAVISPEPDGRNVLVAAGLAAAAGAIALVRGRALFRPVRSLPAAVAISALFLSFTAFSAGYYGREHKELKQESARQAQMAEVSDWLSSRLQPGQRLLLPSRRNEQLSWLWRDRELPEVLFFRALFYLHSFRGMEILDLHPDWIIYIDHDFQYSGPEEYFQWLQVQDRTEIRGAVIQLAHSTPLIRVFRVDYPPSSPPRPPLPTIP